jgi:nicotinate-nucleotide--dimethylbenzimidazole phosphoribosyltransferase
MLDAYLRKIKPLNTQAMQQAQENWDKIAKPLRSLGRLEQMVVQLAGITGSAEIAPRKKAVLVFCADNGIVAEGVTQTGQEVTAACARNFTKGIATVNVFARECGAEVFPIDVGMVVDVPGVPKKKTAYGTKNFAKEPAMTREQARQAILYGIQSVEEKVNAGYTLILLGEMGIGNTTTSSAVFSVLEQHAPESVTGRGAGLTTEGVQHKVRVIEDAIALHRPRPMDVLDVLSKVGGFDICAMAGACLAGGVYRVPVIIDGFISAIAANCAIRLCPECKSYLFASHTSAEPAGKMALEAIGMKAYLECDMCLGEGTGAILAAKLLDFALAAYHEVTDFQGANVEQYELLQ